MKRRSTVLSLFFILAANLVCPPALLAQTCQDEEAMVENYRNDLNELVERRGKKLWRNLKKPFTKKSV
jgi:hypothetical protein